MEWVVKATPRPLYPREWRGNHCIGGWVGLRAGMDECGKISPPAGIRSPDHPARSESLHWLSYAGSQVVQLIAQIVLSFYGICIIDIYGRGPRAAEL